MFFGPIGKTRWPPRALIGWDIFDFFSKTAEGNLTKLDSKQDLNVLYQVCVFRADWKTKMAAPTSDWLRHFWLLLWNRWTELEETWQKARSQCALPSLCFWGRSEKQDGRPGLRFAERKRKRSDSVLWQKPLHQQKCQKGTVTTKTTPQKSSITQRLRTDLGRSVGVTTATQLVWLTGLRAHLPTNRNSRLIKRTHV